MGSITLIPHSYNTPRVATSYGTSEVGKKRRDGGAVAGTSEARCSPSSTEIFLSSGAEKPSASKPSSAACGFKFEGASERNKLCQVFFALRTCCAVLHVSSDTRLSLIFS